MTLRFFTILFSALLLFPRSNGCNAHDHTQTMVVGAGAFMLPIATFAVLKYFVFKKKLSNFTEHTEIPHTSTISSHSVEQSTSSTPALPLIFSQAYEWIAYRFFPISAETCDNEVIKANTIIKVNGQETLIKAQADLDALSYRVQTFKPADLLEPMKVQLKKVSANITETEKAVLSIGQKNNENAFLLSNINEGLSNKNRENSEALQALSKDLDACRSAQQEVPNRLEKLENEFKGIKKMTNQLAAKLKNSMRCLLIANELIKKLPQSNDKTTFTSLYKQLNNENK